MNKETNDYYAMMNGIRPEGCTCEMTRDRMNGYSGPEPAEWTPNPWCAVHPDPSLSPCVRCGKLCLWTASAYGEEFLPTDQNGDNGCFREMVTYPEGDTWPEDDYHDIDSPRPTWRKQ